MPVGLGLSGPVRIVYTVRDLKEMRRHYEEVLGLEIVEVFGEDYGVLLRLTGNTLVQLIKTDLLPPTKIHLSVEVESVSETYRQLAAVAVGEPETQSWGHRNFTTRDPDGNGITFYEVIAAE